MPTRSRRAPSWSRVVEKRSWVSGRSAARPWRRMAIALASQAPIQIGRYRVPSTSLRMTTWRFESMWTRTLSTTISTRRSMARLSHRSGGQSRPHPAPSTRHAHDESDRRAGHEATDVGEERDVAGLRPERRGAADQLEDEPVAEDHEGGHLEQLVEEPEEDERQDPGAGPEHEIHAEDGGDRPRSSDEGRRRGRIDPDLGQRRRDAAEQVERQERHPAEAVLDVVAEDPEEQHVA